MGASIKRVDRPAGKGPGSPSVSRSRVQFISGKDASKLALVVFQVRSGARLSPKEIEAMGFSAERAREAAKAFVRSRSRARAPARPAARRVAGVRP